MRTTCLLALLSMWLLAQASAAPKKLEKKSIANSLAPKAIEPVEQKLDAPSPKISDEALMETPGETVDRAKKQASTTFCVEVRQNKPTYVDCGDANSGSGNKIIVMPGNEIPESAVQAGGLPGPTSPLVPGGLYGPGGPHVPHLPHGLHVPHHGVHFSGPGTGGSADGVPATVHYLLPGGDILPNAFGPGSNGVPFNVPTGGPADGGLNGILYQLPGGVPVDSGVGPNGVHVHVHPNGGFPAGSGGPGGPSPTGVHFHLPAGSGAMPTAGSSGSPVHLSGIECLCAGTPAIGRDGESNDGTPSNEALAVKFLQDLQKNDKPDADTMKAANGDQPAAGQQTVPPTGPPTMLIAKSSGMPFALPMMIGGIPMMRSDSPTMNGTPLLKLINVPSPNTPSSGDAPATGGNVPLMRLAGMPMMGGMPVMGAMPMMGGMPIVGGMPMMRTAGGTPMMGGMPIMGGPMMGGMPIMGGPMMGGMPIMRAGASPAPGDMPVMNGSPGNMLSMVPSSENPKSPALPIMIQMPTGKAGEEPKNPMSPNGVQMTIELPKSGDNSPVPTSPNGLPLVMMNMPMGRAGENPNVPTLPNGLPIPIMTLAGMKANGQLPDGTNVPTGGKMDPALLLRYFPVRPVPSQLQYPVHGHLYPHGPSVLNPMYMNPMYPGHGYVHPHRSQYDCLQDSFQSVPAIQGMRFSRGPDESELPAAGHQDAEAKPDSPAGSEHAQPEDKEGRISHFVADEHNDAVNSV